MMTNKDRRDSWFNKHGRISATRIKRLKRHAMRRKLNTDFDADLRQAKATERY